MNPHGLLLILMSAFTLTATQGATLVAGGLITGTFAEGDPLATLGDRFELIVTYDAQASDTDPTDYFGQYIDPSLSVSLNILGSGNTLVGTSGSITVITATGPDGVVYPAAELWVSSVFDGVGPVLILLQDDDSSIITTDELGGAFGRISDYSLAGFSILEPPARVGNDRITPPLVSGQIDVLGIPEPSTLGMLLLGFVAATRRKRTG